MPTLLPPVLSLAVLSTACGAASDNKVYIVTLSCDLD